MQNQLSNYLESELQIIDLKGKNRGFNPHLTLATRDLTKQNFQKSWSEFAKRQVHFEFTSLALTLLIHNGNYWEIYREFCLGGRK